MQIARMGLNSSSAITGRPKGELLQDIYNALMNRRNETNNDILDVVEGEGRAMIVGEHSFTTTSGIGSKTTTVTIGEIMPNVEYGVLFTRNTSIPNQRWVIANKTTTTFDVEFSTLTGPLLIEFSWAVIY